MAQFVPTVRDDGTPGPRLNVDHILFAHDIEGEDGEWTIMVNTVGDRLEEIGPFAVYAEAFLFRSTVLGLVPGFRLDQSEPPWRFQPPEAPPW